MGTQDTKRLDYASALALLREIEQHPGYLCTKTFEGHALAVKVQRSKPPYLKEPRVVTTRAEWLWLRDLIDDLREREVPTQQPLPLKDATPRAPAPITPLRKIARAQAEADAKG